MSLYIVSRGDEYLKDRRDDGGPFSIYSGFHAEFDIGTEGTVMRTSADLAVIADSTVSPAGCRLESKSFKRSGQGLTLEPIYRDAAARRRFNLDVWLPYEGGSSEWNLRVTNLRPYPVA